MGEGEWYGERLLADWERRARMFRQGQEPAHHGDAAFGEEFRELFGALLEHSFDGVVLNARASRWILEASASFCALTGYSRRDLLGRTSVELGLIDPDDAVRDEATSHADQHLPGLYETWLRCRDGQKRWVQFSHQMLGDDYVLTIVRDMTAQRILHDELQRLAVTDPLTGVLNRRGLQDAAAQQLDAANGAAAVLLIVDLDEFKSINDEHGHAVGDEVLRIIARCLLAVAPPDALIGRMGGDEFAVLLTGSATTAALTVRAAFLEDVPRRLAEAGVPLVAASVGFATVEPGATFDEVLRHADLAMYADKRR